MTVTPVPVAKDTAPLRVPPAQVHFPDEDRRTILRQIDEALASGQLTLGKLGRQLEERFAEHHRAPYAVAVSSGTAALDITLRCLEVTDKEVLIPANTFAATAAAVLSAGARPRFVDCDPTTMMVDVAAAESAIGPDTAALIVVHIGGMVSPDIAALSSLCRRCGIHLVEDAAHAHGSSLEGRMAGTFGIAGAFSFYPTKVMAGGEGGIIVTADEAIAEQAKIYRDQGKAGFLANVHTHLGYNWRMSEPHAAIALSQLARLDESVAHRQHIAGLYSDLLTALPLTPMRVPATASCNFYKYVAFLPDSVDRAPLKQQLRAKHGVGLSGEVYELPLHEQPVFAQWNDEHLPGAEQACASHICLPVSAVMTDEQAEIVVDALGKAIRHA